MEEHMHDETGIVLRQELHDRLLGTVRRRWPEKSFGYLISTVGPEHPTDYLLFEGNVRNGHDWQPVFHAYGTYFVEHDDAGFVATPEESWRVQKEMWARGAFEVGVFHSHQRHPANFSFVDYQMHVSRFDRLWHMIISLRNPRLPQIRVFRPTREGVRELPLRVAAAA
jgi:proteasome lid subunit RPN8/RPN11